MEIQAEGQIEIGLFGHCQKSRPRFFAGPFVQCVSDHGCKRLLSAAAGITILTAKIIAKPLGRAFDRPFDDRFSSMAVAYERQCALAQ